MTYDHVTMKCGHVTELWSCDCGDVCVVDYTDLAMSTVTQRQSIAYTGTFQLLQYYLHQLSADVEMVEHATKQSMIVFKAITVTHDPKMVTLEVVACPIRVLVVHTGRGSR